MKPNIHSAVADGWGGDPVFLANRGLEEVPLRVTGGWDWKGVIFRVYVTMDGATTCYHTCRIRAKGRQHEPHTWTTAGFAEGAEEAEARALARLQRYFGQGYPQPALVPGPRE